MCFVCFCFLFTEKVFGQETYDWYAEGKKILESQGNVEQLLSVIPKDIAPEAEMITTDELIEEAVNDGMLQKELIQNIETITAPVPAVPIIETQLEQTVAPIFENQDSIDMSEIELLYKIVEGEAGSEPYYCKQLVTSVILNRVDRSDFPNTIHEVIHAQNQFYAISKIHKLNASEDTIAAVNSVLSGSGRDFNVLYFRTNYYYSWAKDYKKSGITYFSTK